MFLHTVIFSCIGMREIFYICIVFKILTPPPYLSIRIYDS